MKMTFCDVRGGSLALRYGTAPTQPTLADLGSIGGELRLFESFAVAGDAPLSVGSLELDANPGLTELAGTLSHISVAPAGPIAITNDPNISDCEAQIWVDGLVGRDDLGQRFLLSAREVARSGEWRRGPAA